MTIIQTRTELLHDAEKYSRAWLEYLPICTKTEYFDYNLYYMSNAGMDSLHIDDITNYFSKPYPLILYPQSFNS
jgi:hypothetical protein